MQINIKATGIELTRDISAYVEHKIGSLDKYLGAAQVVAYVEVGRSSEHHKQGEVYKADVRLSGDGHELYATQHAEDLKAAIDLVQGELGHEINRKRGRERSLYREGSRRAKEVLKGFPWVSNPFRK